MPCVARTLGVVYHISVIRSGADAIRGALLAPAGLDAGAVIAHDAATGLRPIREGAAALDRLMD